MSREYAVYTLVTPISISETASQEYTYLSLTVTETISASPSAASADEWLIRARRRGRR